MRYLTLLLLSLLIACQSIETKDAPAQNNDLVVKTAENLQLKYENIQLYPITASENFVVQQADLKNVKSLSQAIDNKRFRITEKKPYGRFEDAGAINSLTVQNKSGESIFLMSGDVVQGGNQDRMIAQDVMIEPNTIQDVAVFCVERNRWQPHEEASDAEKKQFAFKGYYQVASNDLRRTMKDTDNQQEVWNKVQEITIKNDAVTSTGTYAGLEQSEEFTNEREKYLRFFDGKFADQNNVVGLVAVSGDQILGVDVFGHPQLFQMKYESLLYSYVAEAMDRTVSSNIEEAELEKRINYILNTIPNSSGENKFSHNHKMVHFTKL